MPKKENGKKEKKKSKKGSKTLKSTLLVILIPIMIIVLIASFFFAIIDAIVGFIVDVVTSIVDFVMHPLQTLQHIGGTISNAWNKFWNNDSFSPSEFIKEQITEAKVFVPLSQFEDIVSALDKEIDRNTAGLDNITIKEMLLTYYRSIYLTNTKIYIELEDGEENNVKAPFQWEVEEETDKKHMYIQGAVSLCVEDKDGDFSEIVTYTTEGLQGIYEEYIDSIDDKEDYAKSVREYLTKCGVISGTNIMMYAFNTTTTTTQYYYDSIYMGEKEHKNEVPVLKTLDYTTNISEYITPVEFMTNLMSVTGSQHFMEEFMKKVIDNGEIKINIYEITNTTTRQTTEEYSQKSETTGEREPIEYKVVSLNDGTELLTEEIPVNGSFEKIDLKVTNNQNKEVKAQVLANDEPTIFIYDFKAGEEYLFKSLDKPTPSWVKTDVRPVKTINTVITEETNYDTALSSVKNWYIELQQENDIITETEYFTIDNNKAEVLVDSPNDAFTITEPAGPTEQYTDTANPNVIRILNVYTDILYVDWPIQESNANKIIISNNGKEGFLNIVFNYTAKKQETNYDYTKYNFHQMTVSYESDISKTELITKSKQYLESKVPTVIDNTDEFLSLLSNDSGKPGTGEPFKAKKNGGKAIEYDNVYKGKSKVGDLLENGIDVICQILDTAYTDEKICNTVRIINSYEIHNV